MTSDDDLIIQQVMAMVSEDRRIAVDKLRLEDALFQNLAMYGDDAWEFLEEYSKTFDVDMTDFDFGKYFRGEGFQGDDFAIWRQKSYRKSLRYIPISISDLITIAKRKKWMV